MKSILEGRPGLAREINKVAEVAGYLWQKGWAERNGGNITINVTEFVDDEIRQMPAISEPKQIGAVLPHLKGCYFFCKGTQKRMRDLARWPMENGSVIRICDDCASYVIIADQPVMPTSEVASHLTVHNTLIAEGAQKKGYCTYTPHRTGGNEPYSEVPGKGCTDLSVVEYDSGNKGILSAWIGYRAL